MGAVCENCILSIPSSRLTVTIIPLFTIHLHEFEWLENLRECNISVAEKTEISLITHPFNHLGTSLIYYGAIYRSSPLRFGTATLSNHRVRMC